jgi:hypothetical protein
VRGATAPRRYRPGLKPVLALFFGGGCGVLKSDRLRRRLKLRHVHTGSGRMRVSIIWYLVARANDRAAVLWLVVESFDQTTKALTTYRC